jgi:YidC/Oxa1 family membrane protein insertase
MNNKRSPVEQLLTFALLAFAAYWFSQSFFGPKKAGTTVKPAPALALAFKGLESQSTLPSEEAANKEIATLQSAIDSSGKDEYSYWARLRAGLLQQYALKNPTAARKFYDEVINRRKNEEIDAQAIYQKGDLTWRLSESTSAVPVEQPTPPQSTPATANATANSTAPNSASPQLTSAPLTAEQKAGFEAEAATALEQIPFRARGHQDFLNLKIWVPDVSSSRGDPLALPTKWEQLPVEQLLGKGSTLPSSNISNADPRAILPRVDAHYAKTPLYQVFNTVVNWYGANPAFSYGLALITLATVTRLLMQPLIKKQYDSMKGMALIAPEMKKIQDRYKGKTDQESQMRMMKEIREMQKQHGVNPMGCGLSLIIQMPIFFLVVLPMINHYQPRLELTGAHFLWIHSLAHHDIPLLVMYAISMFVSVRLSATPPADEQQRQMQKMTTFMSPMFALVLWSYPSAFILYWMTYNLLSTVFQWRMMKASNPDKDLIKTLIGPIVPPLAETAAATSTASSGSSSGVIPPRPDRKTQALKPALNGASSSDDDLNNGQIEEAPMETVGGSSSGNRSSNNAARRRRRRK